MTAVQKTVTAASLSQLLASINTSVSNLSSSVTSLEKDVASSSSQDFAYPDGISLLTSKNDAMLDYLHHIIALCISKASGRSLADTASSSDQLAPSLVKLRLMLEKSRPLENRLKYQVEKLLSAAADADKDLISGRAGVQTTSNNQEEDEGEDLAYRPNPSTFMQDKARPDRLAQPARSNKQRKQQSAESESDEESSVYRPPKLVPMAYDPDARSRRKDARGGITRNSALLSDLTAGMSSNPYEASSGGVGVGGRLAAQNSSRAKALQRMDDFEEDNFTRLVMSKKDANKRRRDEADIALGGAGLSSGRSGKSRVGGGMEEEFGDLLRSSGLDGRKGKKAKRAQEAYDSLRSSSKAGSTLQRSKQNKPRASNHKAPSSKFSSQVNRLSRK